MKPIFTDALKSLEGVVADNITVAAGGFGLCGIPERSIEVTTRLPECLLNPKPPTTLSVTGAAKAGCHGSDSCQ